jgi:hypothetical protein
MKLRAAPFSVLSEVLRRNASAKKFATRILGTSGPFMHNFNDKPTAPLSEYQGGVALELTRPCL